MQRLRDVHLWRKQADGSWKVVVDVWNMEPAPAATSGR
jgi:ketosteroid isomerase-like protein